MVTVKICGIRDERGARATRAAGADHAGLLFVHGRRRAISVDEARRLRPALGEVEPVGVFLDAPLERVLDVAAQVGLRTVQLHGAEPPAYVAAVARAGLRVVRAVSAAPDLEARLAPFVESSAVFLVDGAAPGSGQLAGRAVGEGRLGRLARRLGRPVWLAGGLRPDNVAALLEESGASGVDVASGVETSGEKNPQRMEAFVRAARGEAVIT